MIFDVKFYGRRKARLVAGGHRAPEVPREEIYSGVVSLETIRTAFVLASLNNLEVCAADVSTAFLYGKIRERFCVIAGDEFGENKGKRMMIDKGSYGLTSSVARFHEILSSTLRSMSFTPCRADHDLWMRNKGDHWEYIATYEDDLLVFSKNPMQIIDTIKETYDLKGVRAPGYYLGGDFDNNFKTAEGTQIPGISETNHSEKENNLSNIWLKHGVKTASSARTYIKKTIDRLETMVEKEFAEQKTPMSKTLHPEIDDFPIPNPTRHSQFRSLVGCANWLVTLGRFDVAYTINTFSRFYLSLDIDVDCIPALQRSHDQFPMDSATSGNFRPRDICKINAYQLYKGLTLLSDVVILDERQIRRNMKTPTKPIDTHKGLMSYQSCTNWGSWILWGKLLSLFCNSNSELHLPLVKWVISGEKLHCRWQSCYNSSTLKV